MPFEARPTGARGSLRFRFRGEDVELKQFSPRATVLDWLREDMGATGTKEGCAEGDYGACTVVLARLKGGWLAYEPFNACILLLGQLDGSELFTIEDLAAGDELHPLSSPRSSAQRRHPRRSGGTASLVSASRASSAPITACAAEPRRRNDTVFSLASLRPRATRTGIFANECSRTL
jgi:hypothetical protein